MQNETMSQRIKRVRKALDLTQQAFAERIGVKQNTIALIESGKRNTSDQLLLGVCREFKISETWLRTGSGSMFLEEDRKFEEFFTIFQALSPVLQDYLIQTAKELLHAQSILLPDKNDQNQPD